MIRSINKWLLAATSIAILYAFTLLVFAADVFIKEQSISQTVSDLFMHLIPTALMLLFVVVGYKKPLVGAIIFAVMAVAYIITGWTGMHWTAHVLIAGPLIVISFLYIKAYKSDKQEKISILQLLIVILRLIWEQVKSLIIQKPRCK